MKAAGPFGAGAASGTQGRQQARASKRRLAGCWMEGWQGLEEGQGPSGGVRRATFTQFSVKTGSQDKRLGGSLG